MGIAAVVGVGAAGLVARVTQAFGAEPTGRRAQRAHASPQYRDGQFRNAEFSRPPTLSDGRTIVKELLFGKEQRKPTGPIPLVGSAPEPATDGLHLTWYGHASMLVEVEGKRVLLDPVWSKRCSPSQVVGPKRLHRPPIPLADLPPLDAIVISHDHYDHLDMLTVKELAAAHDAPFLVPVGVGAHLDRWKVPEHRIIELDWYESSSVAGLTLTCTPAHHFSGRHAAKRNYTLWSSWVVAGAERKVFYTGDSGYFNGYKEIGQKYGPFDLNLVQIGAYGVQWPDIHMFPEEAIDAHVDLGGGLLVPVHWGTFVLAFHAWSEPVDRLWSEAKARGVVLAVPRPGERIDVTEPPPVDGWWQAIC
jgi:L-ascorbate metabolism protein UlaG (beta-lactamase superfamily)